MQQIVVGIDGSPNSAGALAWAIQEAQYRGASVKAVHAWQMVFTGDIYGGAQVDPGFLEKAGRAVLDQAVDQADTRSVAGSIERILVHGGAATALIDAAKDADLLVVGSRGRGGFAGLLLGSVSQQVAHHAPCPLVIVPTDQRGA